LVALVLSFHGRNHFNHVNSISCHFFIFLNENKTLWATTPNRTLIGLAAASSKNMACHLESKQQSAHSFPELGTMPEARPAKIDRL
jgi:hypothetical protein